MPFKFALNEPVRLLLTREKGTVRGRCDYSTADNRYLVRYVAADGRQVEDWHDEDALDAAPGPTDADYAALNDGTPKG